MLLMSGQGHAAPKKTPPLFGPLPAPCAVETQGWLLSEKNTWVMLRLGPPPVLRVMLTPQSTAPAYDHTARFDVRYVGAQVSGQSERCLKQLVGHIRREEKKLAAMPLHRALLPLLGARQNALVSVPEGPGNPLAGKGEQRPSQTFSPFWQGWAKTASGLALLGALGLGFWLVGVSVPLFAGRVWVLGLLTLVGALLGGLAAFAPMSFHELPRTLPGNGDFPFFAQGLLAQLLAHVLEGLGQPRALVLLLLRMFESALSTLLLAVAARRMFPEKSPALAFAAVLALWCTPLWQRHMASVDGGLLLSLLLLFWVMAVVPLSGEIFRPRRSALLVTFSSLAMAYTRPEGLVFLVLGVGVLLVWGWRRKIRLPLLVACLVVLVVGLIPFWPQWWLLQQAAPHGVTALGHWSGKSQGTLREVFLSAPGVFLPPLHAWTPALPLALLALRKEKAQGVVLWGGLLALAVAVAWLSPAPENPVWGNGRYLAAAMPLVCLLVVSGLSQVFSQKATVFLVVLGGLLQLPMAWVPMRYDSLQKEVAFFEKTARRLPRDAVILTPDHTPAEKRRSNYQEHLAALLWWQGRGQTVFSLHKLQVMGVKNPGQELFGSRPVYVYEGFLRPPGQRRWLRQHFELSPVADRKIALTPGPAMKLAKHKAPAPWRLVMYRVRSRQ